MVDSALELSELTSRQGSFVLGPVTATITQGVTALLGANGAGKTTLMRLVVGLVAPTGGTITVEGNPATQGSLAVGYLPQDFRVPKGVRVRDYLAFVAWCRSSRNRRLGPADVDQVLDLVGLSDRVDSKVNELSGGMIRRVGVAQALLGTPRVLVLDEPTAGLDPVQRRDLRELVSRLGEQSAVLLSTHISEDVAATARDVIVLDEGQVAYQGAVDGLIAAGGGHGRSGESVERGFMRYLDREGSSVT